MKELELIPSLAGRLRAGRREEPIRGSADMPNFFRKPHGAGWALVGDAVTTKTPLLHRGLPIDAAELDGVLRCLMADIEHPRNSVALIM
ncbi:MAG TPA: hypothetical protein VN256_25160 [Pyrinomonadaceae bacterium]|nr:hypothetical protein [Pyrinomonadaceae bacterium]